MRPAGGDGEIRFSEIGPASRRIRGWYTHTNHPILAPAMIAQRATQQAAKRTRRT